MVGQDLQHLLSSIIEQNDDRLGVIDPYARVNCHRLLPFEPLRNKDYGELRRIELVALLVLSRNFFAAFLAILTVRLAVFLAATTVWLAATLTLPTADCATCFTLPTV